MAYDQSFTGGVRVATDDVDGDGVKEIITAPGPGGGPHIKAFRPDGTLVSQFMAYVPNFTGGVFVAGTPGANGQADRVITGPGAGGGPHVRVFNGGGGVVGEFLTPPTSNSSGVRVAGGDLDGSAPGDVTIAFGPGPPSIIRYSTISGELLLP
jgi:hypothetical protein